MKNIMIKIQSVITTKPSNAFLLFLTGFFFTQTMLVNILHTKHPEGGWDTSIGMFSTSAILMVSLLALSVCLVSLWFSIDMTKNSQESASVA